MPDNQWSGSESAGDCESDKRQEYHCHVNCVDRMQPPIAAQPIQCRPGTARVADASTRVTRLLDRG